MILSCIRNCLFNTVNTPPPCALPELIKGTGQSQRFSETLGKQMMYLAVTVRQDSDTLAVIRTSQPLTEIDQKLKTINKKFIWASILIAVIAAAPNPNLISNNCSTNLSELALYIQHWLDSGCNISNNWCGWADLDHFGKVDFSSFAVFAELWLAE